VKSWPIRLATLVAVGIGLLLVLDLQPWSLLTIKNVGSTPLIIDRAFEGPKGPAIKGGLQPGERRFGLFRLKSEAGMSVACHMPSPQPINVDGGYFVTWQPYVLALDLNECRIDAAHEVGLGVYSLRRRYGP